MSGVHHLRDESRENILGVISKVVKLDQRGKKYVGRCPFHDEKTPSFQVNPEKGLFYCFGCGIGGDVFTFVMKHEGVDFREAVDRVVVVA